VAGNLNGVKPNERVVKWSEGLSNRVSTIIRRYINISYEVCCLYGFFVYHILSYSFGSIFYHCTYGRMFCMFLFNFVNYIFLLLRLCILIVMCILFHCVVLCMVCVYMCIGLLPPGVNPIAVNKIYHIISIPPLTPKRSSHCTYCSTWTTLPIHFTLQFFKVPEHCHRSSDYEQKVSSLEHRNSVKHCF